MRPITAADLMNPQVLTVPVDMTVPDLAAFLLENEIHGAPVEDREGNLVGFVSVVDIAAAVSDGDALARRRAAAGPLLRGWEDTLPDDDLAELHGESEDMRVGDIMTSGIYSVAEEATVHEIASKMLEHHLHRVLVLREGRAVGIISSSDLIGLLVEER